MSVLSPAHRVVANHTIASAMKTPVLEKAIDFKHEGAALRQDMTHDYGLNHS